MQRHLNEFDFNKEINQKVSSKRKWLITGGDKVCRTGQLERRRELEWRAKSKDWCGRQEKPHTILKDRGLDLKHNDS